MRIQVLSDIHLEFGPLPPSISDADVVVAAGDIDVGNSVLDWLASFNKPVIYVAGNHEIWGCDLHQRIQNLRDACRGSKVHFLENNQLSIGDVTFYGCTLWSDFAAQDPEIMAEAGALMNDFTYITVNGGALEPEWLVNYNHESVQWLKRVLARKTDKKQVVVTHHAPTLKSWGFAVADPLKYAYCNQLDNLIRKYRPALWVHGHVHCRSDYHVLDTRVVCNPRGYHPNKLVEAFEPEKVVEI